MIWILDYIFVFFDMFGRYDVNQRTFVTKCHRGYLGMISQLGEKQQPWPFKKCVYATLTGLD